MSRPTWLSLAQLKFLVRENLRTVIDEALDAVHVDGAKFQEHQDFKT